MGKRDIGGNDNAMMMIDREANFTFVGTTFKTLIFHFKVGTSKQDIYPEWILFDRIISELWSSQYVSSYMALQLYNSIFRLIFSHESLYLWYIFSNVWYLYTTVWIDIHIFNMCIFIAWINADFAGLVMKRCLITLITRDMPYLQL